jgi:hypothetical protein
MNLDTSVELCNAALRLLDYAGIQTLDDESEAAQGCKLYYDFCRKKLLGMYSWGFAIGHARLSDKVADRTLYLPYKTEPTNANPHPAPLPDLPANFPELMNFKYAYRFPDDCLEMINAFDGSGRALVQWGTGLGVASGDYLLSNVNDARTFVTNLGSESGRAWKAGENRFGANPLISYVKDVQNVGLMSEDFKDCFMYFLSGYLVENLRGHSDQAKSTLYSIFQAKFGEAKIAESRRKQLGGWGVSTPLLAVKGAW